MPECARSEIRETGMQSGGSDTTRPEVTYSTGQKKLMTIDVGGRQWRIEGMAKSALEGPEEIGGAGTLRDVRQARDN